MLTTQLCVAWSTVPAAAFTTTCSSCLGGTSTCLIVFMEGFEALGFKGWHYGRCNTSDVGEFIDKLRQPSTGGGSVTIPLKVRPRHTHHGLLSSRVRTDGACGPTGWEVYSIFSYLFWL